MVGYCTYGGLPVVVASIISFFACKNTPSTSLRCLAAAQGLSHDEYAVYGLQSDVARGVRRGCPCDRSRLGFV